MTLSLSLSLWLSTSTSTSPPPYASPNSQLQVCCCHCPLLLLLSTTECAVAPPTAPNVNWEQGCTGSLAGDTCQGYCGAGSVINPNGPPVATCSKTGGWTVTGGCRTGEACCLAGTNSQHGWVLKQHGLYRGAAWGFWSVWCHPAHSAAVVGVWPMPAHSKQPTNQVDPHTCDQCQQTDKQTNAIFVHTQAAPVCRPAPAPATAPSTGQQAAATVPLVRHVWAHVRPALRRAAAHPLPFVSWTAAGRLPAQAPASNVRQADGQADTAWCLRHRACCCVPRRPHSLFVVRMHSKAADQHSTCSATACTMAARPPRNGPLLPLFCAAAAPLPRVHRRSPSST